MRKDLIGIAVVLVSVAVVMFGGHPALSRSCHAARGKSSTRLDSVKKRVRRCLDHYSANPIDTGQNSPWSIMHAMISFGVDSQVSRGGPNGPKVNAISWMCGNGVCRNRKLFKIRDGQLYPRTGPSYQGHDGQFLALLAQCRVMIDYPILCEDQSFTVADLVEIEKLECEPNSELTFHLISLVHYLGTEAKWQDKKQREWTIAMILQQEMAQPIIGATCGGTHRLMALNYALRKRRKEDLPIVEQWAKAQSFVDRYQRKAWKWQNRDGSFSTSWFRGSGNNPEIERKLKTTGHVLEWLVFSASDEELRHPKMIRSVRYLTDLMIRNRYFDWENGPQAHALRALTVYDQRVFGKRADREDLQLSQR